MRPKTEIVDLRFDLYGTKPMHITIGGQQSLWVTSAATGEITGLSRDGSTKRYPVDATPNQIALGGESIWFTMPIIDTVGRIDHTGSIQNYPLPQGSRPQGIVTLEDAAWVTLSGTGELARVPLADPIEIVQPKVMGDADFVDRPAADPAFIAMDDRRSLWFTRPGVADIVRMDADGTTESWTSDECLAPSAIAVDKDAVWIADSDGGGIWRIGRDEKLLQRAEPWPSGVSGGIASDRQGGCWFTEIDGDLVAHLDVDAKLTEYDVSSYGAGPRGVALDRDGIVWVALRSGGIIGLIP
jgi:streptogramin lyase